MSEHNKEMRNVMRAYAAFQMATVLFIISSSKSDSLTWLVLVLFSISIPSTIAYAGLARITEEDELRNPNPISAISSILTFIPSLSAISLIIFSVSKLAAVTFAITSIIWVVVVVRLRNKQQNIAQD